VLITWDDRKSDANKRKHKVSFGEALTAFRDPLGRVVPDRNHSDAEDRYWLIAESVVRRVLIVTFTPIDDQKIRIITARRASTAERRTYMTEELHPHLLCDKDMPDDNDILIDEPLPQTGWMPNPFKFADYHGPHLVTINAGVSDAFRTEDDVNEALWFLLEQGHYEHFQSWRAARGR